MAVREVETEPRGIVHRASSSPPRLTRYELAPDLAVHIEHVWHVTWSRPADDPFLAETLPHPSFHVVLERGASEVRGVDRRRFTRSLAGDGEVFGVKFHPAMFPPLLGGRASALTDRALPLASLGPAWTALEAKVLDLASPEARIETLETFLRENLPAAGLEALRAAAFVRRMRDDPDLLTTADVVRATRTSERALQRLFQEHVGVSPKWVLQRYRLHEALARLDGAATSLAALAADLGYTDQAHFSRNFRAFVGMTPSAYLHRR